MEQVIQRYLRLTPTKRVKIRSQSSPWTGADPGFFLGGGALVSSNKPHIFFFAEYQLY